MEIEKSKEQLHALNLLKVFAILLVFNSHCGDLYPYSVMATGGALGNSLFFILSGYFVTIHGEPFFPWIRKKFFQLYPGMWLVSIVNAIVLRYKWSDIAQNFVYRYIFPTGYWFVGGLLLFNIIIWFLEKYKVFEKFFLYTILLATIYVVWYIFLIDKTVWSVEDHGFFRMIYYFYIYSVGYCLKSRKIHLKLLPPVAFVAAVVGLVGNTGWKFVMIKVPLLMKTQFLCQMFCIVFAVSAIIWGLNIEKAYCEKVPEKIKSNMDFWSRYSLEIYFAQRIAQRKIAIGIPFPINLVIAILCTMVYALLIKKVMQKITKRFL